MVVSVCPQKFQATSERREEEKKTKVKRREEEKENKRQGILKYNYKCKQKIQVKSVVTYLAVVQSLKRTSKSLVERSLHLFTPG